MQSKLHVKELLTHTVIYGFGIILNKSLNFLLLPVYTKYYSPEEIGMFSLIFSLSLFLGVIYTFGLETSFIRFFIDAQDLNMKRQYYSSALFSLLITSLFLSVIIFSISGSISELLKFENPGKSTYLIKLASVFMLADTICRFPLLLFRAKLETGKFSLLNLTAFSVNLISNIVLIIFLGMGVEAIFYCMIISSAVTLCFGLIMTKNYLTLRINFLRIRELFAFGNKFIYIGIFLILIDMSDRYFLKYYFDESIVGIYSANYRLASVMSLMIAAFRFSWTPYFLNLKENPDNKKIISSVFTYFVFAGLLIFLLLSLTMKSLVQIDIAGFSLLNENYRSGLGIVPILLLSYFFSGIYSVLNAAPFLKNKTGSILAVVSAGFIVNLLSNILLIPAYNIYGAALATMISYIVMTLIMFHYSQKIYSINYQWRKIAIMIILSLFAFITGYFVIDNLNQNGSVKLILNVSLIITSCMIMNLMKAIDFRKISMLWSRNNDDKDVFSDM